MPAEGMIIVADAFDFVDVLHYAQLFSMDIAEIHAFNTVHILVVYDSTDLGILLQWLFHPQRFDNVQYFPL